MNATTDTALKPAWGLAAPAGAVVAWGARAIYTENKGAYDANHTKRGAKRKRARMDYFNIELVLGRSATVGDEEAVKRLCRWLDKVALPRLRKECSERYIMRESNDVVEFTDGQFSLKASPQSSHGYLYIGAWMVVVS